MTLHLGDGVSGGRKGNRVGLLSHDRVNSCGTCLPDIHDSRQLCAYFAVSNTLVAGLGLRDKKKEREY